MHVLLRLAAVAAAAALLGLAPAAAAADPVPPKLDVKAAIAALGKSQVHTAPGAAARIDLAVVRKAMAPDTRLLIAPYQHGYTEDQHLDDVYEPLSDWAKKQHVNLIFVEGIQASLVGAVTAGPSTLSDLREQTAYADVTGPVLGLLGYLKDHNADIPYPAYKVVAPTAGQLDDLTAHLRDDPVYNAPGRDDPVRIAPPVVSALGGEFGHDVRIAALPVLTPGDPFVDYAPALTKRFPGSVVLVAQGGWLEIKGPDQAMLTSARDYAFGRFEYSSFTDGVVMANRIGSIGTRVATLRQRKPFGRPQPSPQPKPVPFDARRAISDAAPWALLGSALVLTGSGLVHRRLRTARQDAVEKAALRRERARAFAHIGDLGAKILAVEEGGGTVDPAVAERHATASTLYDQAVTAAAMQEVTKVADEGLHLLAGGAPR